MSWSLLGRLFGVPLIIISTIVGGAIVVVLLFASLTSIDKRDIRDLLTALEQTTGERTGVLLLPREKELWQMAWELTLRLEKKEQELTPEQLAEVTERLVKLVRADLARVGEWPQADVEREVNELRSGRFSFLIRALALTRRPEAVQPLIEIVESGRAPYTWVAMQELANLHDLPESRQALPAIVEVLRHAEAPEARIAAATVLSVLGRPEDADVVAALEEARRADIADLDWAASLSLARLGSDAGRTTLLDLMDRQFWDAEPRYEKVDEFGQVQRYSMPSDRVDQIMVASIEAASKLSDAGLWESIDRLKSDPSPRVRNAAMEAINRRP